MPYVVEACCLVVTCTHSVGMGAILLQNVEGAPWCESNIVTRSMQKWSFIYTHSQSYV